MLLALSSFAYYLGRRRAFSVAQGAIRNLHSLPSYYGLYTAIWCGVPALLLLGLWLGFEDTIITHLVVAELPPRLAGAGPPGLTGAERRQEPGQRQYRVRAARYAAQEAAAHYRNLLEHQSRRHAVAGLALAMSVAALP